MNKMGLMKNLAQKQNSFLVDYLSPGGKYPAMHTKTPIEQSFKKPDRIFFGWYIVFAGLLIQGVAYGGRYSFAVFFPTLLDQFGWPGDLTASILSLHMLFYGFTAPVAGLAVDRFGTRKTMFLGTLLLAAGLALSGLGHQQWHFYLSFGVLTGVGLCLLGSVPLTMVIRNWFERRRGVAISLVYLGSALAFGCYPAIDWLISLFGWRMAFVAEGTIILALFTPVIFSIMYYYPNMKGLSRDGLDGRESQSHLLEKEKARVVDREWVATDWELGKALKTARFGFVA